MALIGNIEPFNPKENEITSYIERLEQLFKCNDIKTEAKKVSLLITLIGGDAYGVLKDLLAPQLPSSKSYDELIQDLKKHYSPKRLIIAERYRFHTAYQEYHEDIKAFTVKLKHLAKFCDFGGFLNDSLRDRFVCGLKLESIKRRLLTEDDLTLEKAYNTAIGMELAEGQMKFMGSEGVQVNKVFQKTNNRTVFMRKNSNATQTSNISRHNKKKCPRCCRIHINNNKCPAISWKCFTCGKIGHTAKSSLCKEKIQELEEAKEFEESDDNFELGSLNEDEGECLKSLKMGLNDRLQVRLCIESIKVDMEVDSGVVRSVIHESDYRNLFPNIKMDPVNFKVRVLTGQRASILGQVIVHVQYLNKLYILPLVVLKSNTFFMPLLGRNWLHILNPDWKVNILDASVLIKPIMSEEVVEKDIHIIKTQNDIRYEYVDQINSQFATLFVDEASSFIKDFKAEFKLKEGIKPMFHKAYEMPYSLKPKVEEELSKMVKSGVLSKVSHSKWASPIVVVPKKNSADIRICVDFKKTLNRVIDCDHCVLPLPSDIFASLAGSKYFTVLDLKGAYQQLLISDTSKELFTINTHPSKQIGNEDVIITWNSGC